MFRSIGDLQTVWQQEREKTLAVMDAIPDQALHQAVTPVHRDLQRMAWHLVETVIEMPGHMGLKIPGAKLEASGFIDPPPSTMKAIREAYAAASISLLGQVAGWQDA